MMELPAFYLDEACSRLRQLADFAGTDDETVADLLDQLGLAFDQRVLEPDFGELVGRQGLAPDAEVCGHVLLPCKLELLGQVVTIYLRYKYAGEFGYEPNFPDDFCHIGTISSLEILSWSTGAKAPDWKPVDIGILSHAMLERIDEVVLVQERARAGLPEIANET